MENTTFWGRNKTWLIIVGIVVILVGWGISLNNSFVRQNNAIIGEWAQVENQYQRRFDLIPNLVNTVKGVSGQEQKIYGEIAEARTRYSGATTIDQKAAAASQLEGSLGRLLVIAENYPILQSSQSFINLSVSLEGTENRISVERMKYNELVKTYNNSVMIFPSSVFARLFGFGSHAYFEVPAANQQNPEVKF